MVHYKDFLNLHSADKMARLFRPPVQPIKTVPSNREAEHTNDIQILFVYWKQRWFQM